MASRYSPESRKEKRALLEALERTSVGHAATLRRLHETLCFLQAHPDDAEVLALVDRALEAIPARVTRLGPGARRRLHDSGIASTTLDYPFGLPMARWLASRFPADADVAWRRFHDEDRLDETLSLLATTAEGDPQIQAAIDGFVDEPLTGELTALPWPSPPEAYLFKQLLVLRHGSPD